MSDVVDRARIQDASAFAELYQLYSPRILRHIRSIVTDGPAAEDLAQAAWERAWQHITRTRPGTLYVQAWLYRIATNLAIDHVRQLAKRNTVSLERSVAMPPSAQPAMHPAFETNQVSDDPNAHVEHRERQRLVAKALSTLSPLEADILLRKSDGLSSQSIARELGMTNLDVLRTLAVACAKARGNILDQPRSGCLPCRRSTQY